MWGNKTVKGKRHAKLTTVLACQQTCNHQSIMVIILSPIKDAVSNLEPKVFGVRGF